MNYCSVHLVGRPTSSVLSAVACDLASRAIVYSFATTTELLRAWKLARSQDSADCWQPTAVVWLQERSGEFAQAEIDAVQILDPMAKCFVVAGCWSEGEPRSGRPLLDATRVYWHQGAAAIWSQLARKEAPTLPAQWIAIHAAKLLDYQGIAGLCQTLGQQTIWQATHQPVISSSPALRIFVDWSSWEAWRELTGKQSAPAILLQGFPRPVDFERARAEGIRAVVAQPCRSEDLRQAISQAMVFAGAHPQIRHKREIRTAA
jgi:hypothetical protein